MVDASTMTGTASLRALVDDALRSIVLGVTMPMPFADGSQALRFEVDEAAEPPAEAAEPPAAQDPEEEAAEESGLSEPEDPPRPED